MNNPSSVLFWIKSNYDQLGEKCWHAYDINNEVILRPFAKDVPDQIEKEYQQLHISRLKKLGLIERQEKTGKKVLLNNLPIKTKNSQKNVSELILRLTTKK